MLFDIYLVGIDLCKRLLVLEACRYHKIRRVWFEQEIMKKIGKK